MTNRELSPGVKLAWQLAGDLAVQEQNTEIQPRHLLYGICSVERLLNREEKNRKSDDRVLLAMPEVDRLNELSQQHGLDLSALRRALRLSSASRAKDRVTASNQQVVGRSARSKQIFEDAARISAQLGGSLADLPCLFRAVLLARIPEIEEASAGMMDALSNAIRALGLPEQGRFSISLGVGLGDLDKVISDAPRTLQIADTLDASVRTEPQRGPDTIERLAALSELTWEFGTRGVLNSMLQRAVDQLLQVVAKAERGVILVRDSKDNELLLRACGPPGAVPMISVTSAKRALAERKGFIWKRGEDLTLSQKQSKIESGMYVPLVVNDEAIGVICLDCFSPQQRFERDDLLLVISFSHQLALAIANNELQLKLKQNADVLDRMLINFSPKVRTRLLQRAQMGRLRLGGEQSVVSVLCADIRGFTRLTAGLPTDDVVLLLNEYFTALTDCIFRHDGTVDKFVGDAILAVFGSPEADPQHCRNAVRAAMDMQEAARQVSQQRKAKGEVCCEIGIGVHTGEVLHGFIGSPERMEFTIIGDTVNRAARYSDGAKGGEVLVSPEVHQHVWNEVEAAQILIPTKHEGDFRAYRLDRLRDRG
jgi:adenylate cyclase